MLRLQDHMPFSPQNRNLQHTDRLPSTSSHCPERHNCEELMQTTRESEVVPNFRHGLKAFASGRKLSLDTDILCYWKTYSLDNELRKLAEVVLAVPATPVSVGIKRFITNFK